MYIRKLYQILQKAEAIELVICKTFQEGVFFENLSSIPKLDNCHDNWS